MDKFRNSSLCTEHIQFEFPSNMNFLDEYAILNVISVLFSSLEQIIDPFKIIPKCYVILTTYFSRQSSEKYEIASQL